MKLMTKDIQDRIYATTHSDEATPSPAASSRQFPVTYDSLRNDFQRDRDRILHCKAFRRLSHKTQVFIAPEGDHFRTRLTHTLEVSQIARTVARALALNEDLTEAIALGHDLGHTPFGHVGERALSAEFARASVAAGGEARAFLHHEQSLRVVEVIENGGRGLNLTSEVRDGILHHTGSPAKTLEGQIVSIADRIAYVNHDIDDAVRAGILRHDEIPLHLRKMLGDTHGERIDALVVGLVDESYKTNTIRMRQDLWDAMMELRTFLRVNVYESYDVIKEVEKAERLISTLYRFYLENPSEIQEEYLHITSGDIPRAVTDYIACMTDRYALHCYAHYFIPSAGLTLE